MFRKLLILLLLVIPLYATAQVELSYYLPENVSYDQEIPTPASVIGHEVGEWHVTHDKLVYYMRELAEASDRIGIEQTGTTYEGRPQLLLTITSPENHENIEAIKTEHAKLNNMNTAASVNTDNMPVVIWMGYSIHGNEASGSNAALAVAYHLAAAQGEEIEQQLQNTVILFDPSFNPDGLNRFATWVNMHKSKNLNPDPNTRELNEVWPGGRTNHYWFDLNRDWLFLQHPESRNRVIKFQEWKPNILTDHHEMGSSSTFFFQPGVPSRRNPITPEANVRLTESIADFHIEALDNIGSLYFSEEGYDDFYYGKGSTYPDAQGSIGILFEQASARGHLQETENGLLSFPFAIKNQFTTSLSTLKAGVALRKNLLDYQKEFYADAAKKADADNVKALVYGSEKDAAKNYYFTDILMQHKIKIHPLQKDLTVNGKTFQQGSAYIIPLKQSQYSLIKGIFSTQTSFADSLFYDVSAWTLPYAFNQPYAELSKNSFSEDLLADPVENLSFPEGAVIGGQAKYAYVFPWDGYLAPKALYTLLAKGVRAKVATNPLTINTAKGTTEFSYGSINIPIGLQDMSEDALYELMQELASENGIEVYAINTGDALSGSDLGSRNFDIVQKPSIAMLVGEGVRSYDAGEVWHLLDYRFDMPVTLIDKMEFSGKELDRYNTLVMVDGRYNDLLERQLQAVKDWVAAGNTLILMADAVYWGANNGLSQVTFKKKEGGDASRKPYAGASNDLGAKVTGGAIFEGRLDVTHPLGYGYTDSFLPIFKNSNAMPEVHKNPYATPLVYTQAPLLSGYIHQENLDQLKGSASILVDNFRRGKVISMVDNPNFRAFWYGTNKLFLNALFFGNIISGRTAR